MMKINNLIGFDNQKYTKKEYVDSALNQLNQRIEEIENSQTQAITLGKCLNLVMSVTNSGIQLSWRDPEDVLLNDTILSQWYKTVLVCKDGSYPSSWNDGIVLTETSLDFENRNEYSSTPFLDTLELGLSDPHYALFSQNTAGKWNSLEDNRFVEGFSWWNVQNIVRSGRGAEEFPVGTVFMVDHSEYQHSDGTGLWFRVVGHDLMDTADNSLQHCMILNMVDCLPFEIAYDVSEDSYALTADTIASNNKTYYRFESNNYIALVKGTDYSVGDTIPDNQWFEANRNEYTTKGRNNWASSNIRQWINSEARANQWFVKQNIWDKVSPELANKDGFLCNIDPGFKAVLADMVVKTGCSNKDESEAKHKELVQISKMFLIDWQQAGFGTNNENMPLPYFADANSRKKNLMNSNTQCWWWLRSPTTWYSYDGCVVVQQGTCRDNVSPSTVCGISVSCAIA